MICLTCLFSWQFYQNKTSTNHKVTPFRAFWITSFNQITINENWHSTRLTKPMGSQIVYDSPLKRSLRTRRHLPHGNLAYRIINDNYPSCSSPPPSDTTSRLRVRKVSYNSHTHSIARRNKDHHTENSTDRLIGVLSEHSILMRGDCLHCAKNGTARCVIEGMSPSRSCQNFRYKIWSLNFLFGKFDRPDNPVDHLTVRSTSSCQNVVFIIVARCTVQVIIWLIARLDCACLKKC